MLATFPDFWDYSARLVHDPESRGKNAWLCEGPRESSSIVLLV
jgi:hypothetical protein